MDLGRIKKRRKQLGFTQADMAKAVGVERGTYYRYEKGEIDPPSKVIEAMAVKLEASADWLLGLVAESHERLTEQELSADERILIAKVRSGEMKEAANAALDLAEQHHEANISGMEPATDS